MSVTRAAGCLPIKTVGDPLTIVNGNPGCGIGVGTGPAGWIGAWQCGVIWMIVSPSRAAGWPMAASNGETNALT